jgi:hypothetical protein
MYGTRETRKDRYIPNDNLKRQPASTVPEFIDPVFAKTSPKRALSVTENERFVLVLAKTGSINSGTGLIGRKSL